MSKVVGTNQNALFSLSVHRGEGMCLLAMNWKGDNPPENFVGFWIKYKPPQDPAKPTEAPQFWDLKNRLSFDSNAGSEPSATRDDSFSTEIAPLQVFHWVHFPRNANLKGDYVYVVTPVFEEENGKLNYGEAQEVALQLYGETYPDILNVSFTRGFVSSQAFARKLGKDKKLGSLLPHANRDGLNYASSHQNAAAAYEWMGFEAREILLKTLRLAATKPNSAVKMIAYDLNSPEILDELLKIGPRLEIIIDNSGEHKGIDKKGKSACEDIAESRLKAAGAKVIRQKMGQLQHNKLVILIDEETPCVLTGSTNFSWSGLYLQSNHMVKISGNEAVTIFSNAFDQYFESKSAKDFEDSGFTSWFDLKKGNLDIKVTFSPHNSQTAVLESLSKDICSAKSNVFYSIAFLAQTGGLVTEAINTVVNSDTIYASGISNRNASETVFVSGTSKNHGPAYVTALDDNRPLNFLKEYAGNINMHHKFVVIDFGTENARVYFGSFNMSEPADIDNGEHLILAKNGKIATSFMIEALRLIDHYEYRNALQRYKDERRILKLRHAPKAGEIPWWNKFYEDKNKITRRALFK